ncbi:hypothetical protein [Vibrio sp. WXL103]|uniref:hypothetical protein n=1 Tax=Vibrio sp. WXL103 TaxID=3450710 RepID=UPI003EC84F17
MHKYITYIIEVLGLVSAVGLISYISWTKMILGSALALLGAFFPEINRKTEEEGQAQVQVGKINVSFRGGLRFAVVVAGIILIVGSLGDGVDNMVDDRIESFKSSETTNRDKFDADDNGHFDY